ncbi:hypothetical protein C2S52_014523 [Perilla frutescens var. hirtella]|nr:hypothetical protein C2S52_014523 [Perilla frutescens var. hirtella]
MASTQSHQNEDYTNNMYHHAPSTSQNAVGTFGEPEIMPRVGDEYQVELPQLLGESYSSSCAEYRAYSAQDGIRADSQKKLLLGSPIKLAWIRSEVDFSHDLRKSVQELENVIGDYSSSNSHLVPGTCDEQWTTTEKDCLLLGLYIFAKDFVEVRKFVGTKEMGALQSFYYGTFYSSPEHRRWSDIRRMKSRKDMFGRGIFSGVRLQKLLSRVLPRVGECRSALLEVSKSFKNAKISMADYVFTLKAMVGADILLEAIGIGRAHQDRTVSKVAREPVLLMLNHEEVGHSNGAEQRESSSINEGLSEENEENHSASLMRFTIVDTSLSNGKIVEFRTLPFEADCMAPITKIAQISTTCSDEQTQTQAHETNNQLSQVSLSLNMLPSTSSVRDCIEQPRTQLLIDLNLTYAPSDSEDGLFVVDSSNEQDITSNKLEEADTNVRTEEQSSLNPTRYSMRQRPPTTRVLKAFARGYLAVNWRQKRKRASSHDDHA